MEFIFAIAGLVALVWVAAIARKIPRFQLNPVIVIGVLSLLVGTVFGPSFFSLSAGPIPITFDRVLIGCMFALFAFRFLKGKENLQSVNGADIAILGLLAVLMISTFTHDWSYRDNLPLSRLLFFNILPIGMYFVAKNSNLSQMDLKFVLGGFALLGVYLSLTAVAEMREWHWAVFPSYINDPEVQEFLGRGRGPLHNPVINGMLIIVGCCCTFLLGQHVKHRKLLFTLAGIATLIGCLGAFATLTRIVWFSTLIAIAVLIWSTLRGNQRRIFMVVTIVGAIFLGVVAKSGALNSFKRDKHVTTHEMSKSAGLRVIFWVIAKKMFEDKPMMGHGFAQYTQARQGYLTPADAGTVETTLGGEYIQHNIVLSYATETGLFGTFFLLAMLGSIAFNGLVVWLTPDQSLIARQTGLTMILLVCAYFLCGMFQDVTVITMANSLLLFWGGLVSNLYSRNLALQRSRNHSALETRAGTYPARNAMAGQEQPILG